MSDEVTSETETPTRSRTCWVWVLVSLVALGGVAIGLLQLQRATEARFYERMRWIISPQSHPIQWQQAIDTRATRIEGDAVSGTAWVWHPEMTPEQWAYKYEVKPGWPEKHLVPAALSHSSVAIIAASVVATIPVTGINEYRVAARTSRRQREAQTILESAGWKTEAAFLAARRAQGDGKWPPPGLQDPLPAGDLRMFAPGANAKQGEGIVFFGEDPPGGLVYQWVRWDARRAMGPVPTPSPAAAASP
jgi:hypothetical protein